MARISITGAGYVGLVTGACLAELGHTVTCLEVDGARLATLRRGELPIFEPGLDRLVTRQRQADRLSFTDDYATAIPRSGFAFVAVNTPPGPDGQADSSYALAAVRSILEHAQPGLTIVIKSTVPVGTADGIAELAAQTGQPHVHVVSNPEFLRQGSAIKDFLEPDRIVVGAEPPAAGSAVAGLYASIDAPIITCGRRSAEIAKYVANAYLATRISFMNEISAICEATHADIEDVARIVGSDRRIGPAYLRAGLGWGGSCFPKDLRALAATAAEHGQRPSILEAAFSVNARQREQAFQHLRAATGLNGDSALGILGLSFKPGTDDIREAPALDVIGRLVEEGIRVRAHDPAAMANAVRVLPHIHYCRDAYEVAEGSDALLLATEWDEYLNLDWTQIQSLMRGRVIVDGRNVLDGSRLTELGFTYLRLGGPAHPQSNGQLLGSQVSGGNGGRNKAS